MRLGFDTWVVLRLVAVLDVLHGRQRRLHGRQRGQHLLQRVGRHQTGRARGRGVEGVGRRTRHRRRRAHRLVARRVVVGVVPLGGVHLLRLLLGLHAPVLEPDLDLALRERDGVRDLYPPPARQVAVRPELLLQLQRLEARVRLASPLRRVARVN